VSDGHVTDDLAAYVLGSLEPPERARLDAHLGSCERCAQRAAEYRAVAGTLPLALDPAVPPTAAWPAILEAARATRSRGASRPRAWLRAARWPAVAALVASLVVWNVTLQHELTRRAPGPAPGPEVDALSRRPGRIVVLEGTGAPQARARIFVAVDGGGHLAVSGLRPLPRTRLYQLWFVRGGAPALSGATFGVDGTGRAWAKVTIPATLDGVTTVVITEEPAPGGATPSGTVLLEARP
jgi:anti-sigma factor RsiW